MSKDPYLFPTGAIREAEKKLFDENDMERMVDADDVNKSFKVFNDLSYADELLDMQSPSQYREVLSHDLGQIKDFLATITPDPLVLTLALAEYDFHNLKIIFKASLADKEEVEHVSSLSTIPSEKIIEIVIKQNNKITLPDEYNSLVREAQKDLEKLTSPREIDSYFDKKYFTFILDRANELGDDFLVQLMKVKIDIANIKIVIRSKLLDRSVEEIKKDIIQNGNIGDHDLIANYSKEVSGLIKTIAKTFSEPQINNELDTFLEKQELWQLEKALDNYLMRFIKESKMKPHGPATLITYFLAKKNAIRNIQIVMTGKINNIEPKEIKERVRELY